MHEGSGVQFLVGFHEPRSTWPFGSASSFGAPGSGGSLGFAGPSAEIGYAYVTSQLGTHLTGDARKLAFRDALYSAIADKGGCSQKEEARSQKQACSNRTSWSL